MRRELLAALALTVLLFGSAYLAAGDGRAEEKRETEQAAEDGAVTLRVLDNGQVEDMTLEKYLQGVVRGEMPASFEMEALKAQAAAERTYVYYQLAAGRKERHPEADVCTDHTCCSAFLSEQAAREKWGGDYDPWEARIEQAVAETDGQTVLYGGKPILAVFHSSSAGKTAAAGQVWSGDLPYLQSVDSPESEETVPNYYSVVTFTAAEAKEKLLAARPGLKLEGTPGGLAGGGHGGRIGPGGDGGHRRRDVEGHGGACGLRAAVGLLCGGGAGGEPDVLRDGLRPRRGHESIRCEPAGQGGKDVAGDTGVVLRRRDHRAIRRKCVTNGGKCGIITQLESDIYSLFRKTGGQTV